MKNLFNFNVKYFLLLFFSALFAVLHIHCSSSYKIKSISEHKIIAEVELKRKLKAGENHQYSIQLNTGDMLHIKAEQFGIDLIAKVESADSMFTEMFDSPTGELGVEDIYLTCEEDRKYNIDIYPAQKYADPGDYVLKIVRSGKASESDKKWMAALVSTQKADKMRSKPDMRQESIKQYESAMAQWLVLKDTLQFAKAKRSLGFVNIRLRNYDYAIETFTQLLPLWKRMGDARAAGFTLLIVGRVYDLQKEYKKALEYNLHSLPYWIETKDRDQESFTLMNIGDLYSYLGDKQKTNESFEQSLKTNELSERPSVKAVILRDYANSLMRLGDDEKAIQLYKQSIIQWQATINRHEEARTAVLLAEYFSKKANQKEAVRYYQEAHAIWQKMNELAEIKMIQEVLIKFDK